MKLVKKIFETAANEGRSYILENEAKEILNAYGVPVPPYDTATTAEDAAIKARKLGFPVVLKILSKDIIHKSDAGGVRVNLRDEDAVKRAFTEIIENARKYGAQRGIEVDLSRGVLISRFADMGTEVIVGVTKDPQFGHAIMFGLGGIFVEVLKDVTFRLIPLTEMDAKEMIFEIKAAKILEGVRGQPPRDTESLIRVIMAISKLVEENPQISELDCNPVMLYERGKGALVVDARIIVDHR